MKTFKIKRITKPGEPNVNGLIYDLESYRKELDWWETYLSESRAELFFCSIGSEYYVQKLKRTGFEFVDLANSCGKIIEITDDYIVIEPLNEAFSKAFDHYIENGYEMNALMRYTGNLDRERKYVYINNIITFDIFVNVPYLLNSCVSDNPILYSKINMNRDQGVDNNE